MNNTNTILAHVKDKTYRLDAADENVAAFLAQNSFESVRICNANDATIFSTFGFFLDKCKDYDYFRRIQPLVAEYQLNPSRAPAVRLTEERIRSVDNNSRKI